MGREEEGLSSNRPELVAFTECLEAHDDRTNLLYLTDSEARVQTGATTLLIKVKVHRGDPLNEEADIRAEMGRLKEYKETIWNDSSDRTVYEWSVTSTKHGGSTVLKTSVWSNTVRNYIRQKEGEIEDYKALAIGAQKWCKEHIPT